MLLGNATASAYPFTADSTMELTNTGITMPAERMTGAKLYPKVENNTLFHIRRLKKTKTAIELDVVDDDDNSVFKIYFPISSSDRPFGLPPSETEYGCTGYAVQDGGLCGCVVGDHLLLPLLKAMPSLEFSMESFVFSPSVCFLRIMKTEPVGRLLYKDSEVNSVQFSTDIGTIISTGSGYTIDTTALAVSDTRNTVKQIKINDDYVLGGEGYEDVYIRADKDSGVRVISEVGGIVIGRLAEL